MQLKGRWKVCQKNKQLFWRSFGCGVVVETNINEGILGHQVAADSPGESIFLESACLLMTFAVPQHVRCHCCHLVSQTPPLHEKWHDAFTKSSLSHLCLHYTGLILNRSKLFSFCYFTPLFIVIFSCSALRNLVL